MGGVNQISLFDEDMNATKELSFTAPEEVVESTEIEEEEEKNVAAVDFDENEIVPYEVGDRVRVYLPPNREEDGESEFYIGLFQGKRGVVSKIILYSDKPPQYEVDFEGKIATVYHDEIKIGWGK